MKFGDALREDSSQREIATLLQYLMRNILAHPVSEGFFPNWN
jgi:hypothetical protein